MKFKKLYFLFVFFILFPLLSWSTSLNVQSVNVITGEYLESKEDLLLKGPQPFSLTRSFNNDEGSWQFNYPLSKEDFTEFAKSFFEYDSQGNLSSIKIFNNKKDKVFSSVNFSHPSSSQIDALTHFNEKITFTYKDNLIEKVETPFSFTSYQYEKNPLTHKAVISKKEGPDSRYLIIEYYSEGKHKGKVKCLKAPAGIDATPIIINEYVYSDGFTTVYDALRNKTIYRYLKNKLLSAIEKYQGDSLYKAEKFFWNEDTYSLKARAIVDGKGQALFSLTYLYNDKLQVIKESIYGNLSGKNNVRLNLDLNGFPLEQNIENYSIEYIYKKEAPYLLHCKKEDNGVSTFFSYDPKTLKTLSKIIFSPDNLAIRHFYFYDEEGFLIKEVLDNGSSFDFNNLIDVTERHSTLFSYTDKGLLKTVEDKFLDLNSHLEKTLKTTHYHYSPYGKIIQTVILTNDGNRIHESNCSYDEKGYLVSQQDDKSSSFFVYDMNGNCISHTVIEKEGKIVQKKSNYDLCNRLIYESNKIEDAGITTCETVSYEYDYVGNKIATIDTSGNKITYTYDALGRIEKITYPEVLDINDNSYTPIEKKVYDILDNVTESEDALGNVTYTTYNSYGKPTEVLYPDGSTETFSYSKEGLLKEAKKKNGLFFHLNYDFLGRVTSIEHYDRNGNLYDKKEFIFNSFRMLSSKDFSGKFTTHTYDDAGRETSKTIQGNLSLRQSENVYDEAGKLLKRKEWFGKGALDYTSIIADYDDEGKILETRLENAKGTVLKKEEKKSRSSKGLFLDYLFQNDRGQTVLQTNKVEENGLQIKTTYDALLRKEKIETLDFEGKTLKEEQFRYDALGNKVKETHTTEDFKWENVWHYAKNGKVESITEGVNSSSPKTTTYRYNVFQELETLIRPNGISLHFTYDSLGNLYQLISSDQTISYRYSYNLNKEITHVEDLIHSSVTERMVDDFGNVVMEILGNGLTVQSQYDDEGKRIELTFPDHSKAKYEYDSIYLKKVKRVSSSEKTLYQHEYLSYDLQGNLLEEKLIGEVSHVVFENAPNQKAIRSNYFNSEALLENGKTISYQNQDGLGEELIKFQHDKLGQITSDSVENYSYDGFFNRKTSDSLCQYDENGCLVKKIDESGNEISFEYDALNRLIKVTKGNNFYFYLYDAFGRRISKTVQEEGESKTFYFLYDQDQEIGTYTEGGINLQLRIPGIAKDSESKSHVAIEIDSIPYAPLYNHSGSIVMLINIETKEVEETIRYTAFGKPSIFDKNGENVEKSSLNNPWQYYSKRLDEETGFVYFGKRYYDPEMGRFTTPDPLGFVDGLNRYAFLLNNPIDNQDFHGLYSIGQGWTSFKAALSNMFKSGVEYLKNQSFNKYIKEDIDKAAYFCFDKTQLKMIGYFPDRLEKGVYGTGELHEKVRVTAINGILNLRDDCTENVDALSKQHGGVNIHYVFHPTEGWTWDMINAAMAKFGFMSKQSELLADTWKQLIQEMGGVDGGGLIVHYAHSIGGTNTLVAKELLTPEEQRMIRIITIGTATLIPEVGFESVINYVSLRDGVTKLTNPTEYFKSFITSCENIIFVGSHLDGFPMVEHLLSSQTYSKVLEMLGEKFLEEISNKFHKLE